MTAISSIMYASKIRKLVKSHSFALVHAAKNAKKVSNMRPIVNCFSSPLLSKRLPILLVSGRYLKILRGKSHL